jgi:hypothetical protein
MNVEDRRNFHCWGWVRILLLMAKGSMVEAGRGNASQQTMGEKEGRHLRGLRLESGQVDP